MICLMFGYVRFMFRFWLCFVILCVLSLGFLAYRLCFVGLEVVTFLGLWLWTVISVRLLVTVTFGCFLGIVFAGFRFPGFGGFRVGGFLGLWVFEFVFYWCGEFVGDLPFGIACGVGIIRDSCVLPCFAFLERHF